MIQRSFLNVHGFWISIVNLSYYYLGFWVFFFFWWRGEALWNFLIQINYE